LNQPDTTVKNSLSLSSLPHLGLLPNLLTIILSPLIVHLSDLSLDPSFHIITMSLNMDDILHGDLDDPSPGFQGVNDEPSPTAQNPSNHHSSDEFEHTDPHSLFNPLSNSDRDVNMID
jgi:hypothetical protein